MAVRTAQAVWEGTLREGNGKMSFGSGAYEGAYTWSSRFEEASGTNPEELLGAAHAGCFSLSFSGRLTRAEFPPTRIKTTAKVYLEKVEEAFSITHIELETEAQVPGIDEKTFQELAVAAKDNCPVSRALTGVKISVSAKLVS
jgi:osmotically inducible protein OsmC